MAEKTSLTAPVAFAVDLEKHASASNESSTAPSYPTSPAGGTTLSLASDELKGVPLEKQESSSPVDGVLPVPVLLDAETQKLPGTADEEPKKEPPAPKKEPEKRFKEVDTGYLDGLRGIAMIMVFNEHYFTHTFAKLFPEVIQPGSARDILRSKMGLIFFFMLAGRLNVTSWFRRLHRGKPLVWKSLPDAMLRRTWRLAVMSVIACIAQATSCAGGAYYPAQKASPILKIGDNLWYPDWCTLVKRKGYVIATSTSFSEIAVDVMRIFTNRDHVYQLKYEGMLWSMYTQLWGMMFCLFLMPVLMYMPLWRRQALYLVLMVALASTYSTNQPFLLGIWLADLAESQILERLRLRSRWTYISLELVLGALTFLFLCYNRIETQMLQALAPITFREGVLGVNLKKDDFGGSPAILLRAFMVFLWLEMSIMGQWLIGNWLFKALGRIALGFYVSQMPIVFGILPPMVVKWHKEGVDYWSLVSYGWCLCFTLNWAFGWVLGKTIDRWSISSSAWLSKNLATRDTVSFLGALVRLVIDFFLEDIPAFLASIPGRFRSGQRGFGRFVYACKHWRTPEEQPEPIGPPEAYGFTDADLKSTIFTSDVLDTEQARRAWRLLRMSSCTFILLPVGALGVGFIWGWFNPWAYFKTPMPASFSLLWKVLWLFTFPFVVITFVGFMAPDITLSRKQQDSKRVYRDRIHKLYIVSVTRGTNEDATRRCHLELRKLEKYHPAVEVIVLTDEPNAYPDLNNIVTPKAYVSPGKMAKHKARALDYFRHVAKLTPYDWVMHMDEESIMDAASLRGCMDMIRYTPHDFGQGIILYNAHNYWKGVAGWAFTVADALRVGDDLARFSLQANIFKRPVFGVHGSFLMINGEVENKIGWDFGTLTEDFEFSQVAWAKGYTLGRIHGIVREQSPSNVLDFLKQRRRWYMGIAQLAKRFTMPALACKVWTAGVFCLIGTGINLLFSFLPTGNDPTPYWLYIISCWSFGTFQVLYSAGVIFQDMDYYDFKDWWIIPIHVAATFFISMATSGLEAAAVIWAMSSEIENVGFEVIKK
ncbi:uncharacterized protein PFL1_01767 [Pseudozyma flocculosa PF-1]|uniref:Related to beta 1,4-mannosyltransferase (Egghead protein) n=1 Tax=Pseudozyma flocculosa TaxID=84751 RepID=A0A5C3EX12_9BASI|nr:uncharacterized protein PFL1_01767 [Pseudozyma flocculosa PF-1]EPQ30870.1 hypothetical protein PFL1_01767 [Pseudozyma flocculosa PF-1]SPO36758.1 related to beta 1,4-mannosyltransferase (egghead protein) [Pseudozyma flocculosa]